MGPNCYNVPLLGPFKAIYPDGDVVVNLNTYSALPSNIMREDARGLNIELLVILLGCIDQLQPLDRRIFGFLKTHARRMSRKHSHETHDEKELHDVKVARLFDGWDVTVSVFRKMQFILGGMSTKPILGVKKEP
jgi:hypothetical protein